MGGFSGNESDRRVQLSRRRLLQNAAGVVAVGALPGVLAACGSDGGGATSGTASGTTGAGEKVGGVIDYLGWQGDDLPEVLAPWKKENNVKIQSSYISGLKDIPAKFAAGGGAGFDIIGGSSNGIPLMLESGVPLTALDLDRLPNLSGLNPFLRDSSAFRNEDDELVAVPYGWGVQGISYDSTQMSAPTAWADLLEPEFTGKITIIDDGFTVFATAAQGLGITFEEMTQEDLQELKSYLTEVLGQAKTLSPTFGDMANVLASGEVIAAWCGYPGINAFAAEAGNPNTALELKEGSSSYAEIYAIPTTGQNQATAYAMIDEVLESAVNADAANSLLIAPAVNAAWSMVDPTVRGFFPRDAAERESLLETAPLVVNPPIQSSEFVTFGEVEQAWIEIKSA